MGLSSSRPVGGEQRFALSPKDVARLPRASGSVRVLCGIAWITAGNRDIFLTPGQSIPLPAARGLALVSGLGGTVHLVLEAAGRSSALAGWRTPLQRLRQALLPD